MKAFLLGIALALAVPAQAQVPGTIFKGVGVRTQKDNFAVGTNPATASTIIAGGTKTNSSTSFYGVRSNLTRLETSGASANNFFSFGVTGGISSSNTQNVTGTQYAYSASPSVSLGAVGTISNFTNFYSELSHLGTNTITTHTGFRFTDPGGTGPVTNVFGVMIARPTRGGTNNVGLLMGATSPATAGNYAIRSEMTEDSFFAGAIQSDVASTPSNPASGKGKFYIKGSNFVIQYNDGGTVRYKYLDLTGTGVTWTHSTTAP